MHPELNDPKWYPILDTRVLKKKMYVKTCLDCSDVIWTTNDNGEETDDGNWFTGQIVGIDTPRDGTLSIYINRDEEADNWQVDINSENMEYIQIYIDSEWDE